MATTVVNSIVGFGYWILAARLFPPDIVGIASTIMAVSSFVVILTTLGVGGMLIQSLPEQDKSSTWSAIFWSGMASSVITSIALGCAALAVLPMITPKLAELHIAAYATLFAVATAALTAAAVLDYVFIAERATGNMLNRNLVAASAKVLLLFPVILLAGVASTLNLLVAWAAASVIGLAFGIVLLLGRASLRVPRPLSALFRTAFRFRTRLLGNQLIGTGGAMLPYLLPLVVTTRLSPTHSAYFYTTWMVGGVFLIIAPAVSQSLFAEGAHRPRDLRTKARSALATSAAILLPAVLLGQAMGGVLLSAFGANYSHNGVDLLRLALLASIPDAITAVYISVLRLQGRFATAAGLSLAISVGTVGLSWFLLPSLGISAVGWAFLLMELCACGFIASDMRRHSAYARTQKRPEHMATI